MAGTVGTFKKDHHVVFGVALVGVGLFGVVGSVTGRLAVMLAALFDPSALTIATSSGSPTVPLVPPAPETPPGENPPTTEPGSPPSIEPPTIPAIEPPSTPAIGGGGGIIGDLGGFFSHLPELPAA